MVQVRTISSDFKTLVENNDINRNCGDLGVILRQDQLQKDEHVIVRLINPCKSFCVISQLLEDQQVRLV